MTTLQTTELLAALHVSTARYREAMRDGRLSWIELAGFLQDIPELRRALDGIHLVPAELADLTPEELPPLADQINVVLAAWGLTARQQDITTEVLRALVDAIPVFQEAARRWEIIVNLPPSAEPA